MPIAELVREVGGLQAQDMLAACLQVRSRRPDSTEAEVRTAFFEERLLVRGWLMRGTLHAVPTEDFRWHLALLGPMGLRKARLRLAALGLDGDRVVEVVRSVLADGPLDRHELAAAARRKRLRFADDPQAPAHLVGRAAMEGVVCEAGIRAGKSVYGLIDDVLGPDDGPAFDRDTALAELARRHARAFPPTTPHDFAAWSGLPMSDARRAYDLIGTEVPYDSKPAGKGPHVSLLGAWDSILLCHRDRSLILRPGDAEALNLLKTGGVLRPTVLVDGMVEGTWRFQRSKPEVATLRKLPSEVSERIEREAADVLRFRA